MYRKKLCNSQSRFFFSFSISLFFLDILADVSCRLTNDRYLRHAWPGSNFFPWAHWQMFSIFSVDSCSRSVTRTYLIYVWNSRRTSNFFSISFYLNNFAWNSSLLREFYCCQKSFITPTATIYISSNYYKDYFYLYHNDVGFLYQLAITWSWLD